MGQQQLLLLVLGIVIVGLAVVVGIQAFGENQKKANADALTNDAIRIASDAQAWALKPTAFGGGNGSLLNVTLAKLGYTTGTNGAVAGAYGNLNGAFALSGQAADKLVITGCNGSTKNQVVTTIQGSATVSVASPGAITTAVTSADACANQS